MSSIAQYARAYADALDRLEMVRSYTQNGLKLNGEKVTVSWFAGSSCTGYKELAEEVGNLVSAELEMLIARAVDKLNHAQDKARRDMEQAARHG
jgi:hypothetical protein